MGVKVRNWHFRRDMNFDGHFTISDVWLFANSVYFYPGDFIIKSAIGTGIGKFFELSHKQYGGMLSAFISFVFWCFAITLIFFIYIYIRDFFVFVHEKLSRSES